MKNRIIDILSKTTIAAVALTSIGLGSAAFAQSPGNFKAQDNGKAFTYSPNAKKHKAKHGKKRMAKLNKRLKLSPVQRKAMRTVMVSQRKDMRAIRQMYKGNRKAAKRAVMASRKQHAKKVKGILTPGQFKQFKRIRHKQRANKRLARMSKQLNLSATQRAQIKSIRTSNHAKARVLIKNANGNRAAARPKLKRLRKRTNQRVMAVLTPAQQAKLVTLRHNRAPQKG